MQSNFHPTELTLGRISPSRYTRLLGCPLRELLAASKKIRPLSPSVPSAKVGVAIHSLVEKAGKGDLDGFSQLDILSAWEGIIGAIEQEMNSNDLDRHLVPLKRNMIDYEVKMRRACLFAAKLTETRNAPLPSSFPELQRRKVGGEIWVQNLSGSVGGYIDLVRSGPDGLSLVDYKTGAMVSPDDGQIKEEYDIQMKLYAALYHEQEGIWPAKLLLEGLGGESAEVQFTHDDCMRLLRSAEASISELNTYLERSCQSFHDLMGRMAKASSKECRYCQWRPGCASYWNHVATKQVDDGEWPCDVAGSVQETRTLRNGMGMIVLINPIGPFVGMDGTVRITGIDLSQQRFSIFLELMESDYVRIVNLSAKGAGGGYNCTPFTSITKLNSEKEVTLWA